MQISDFFIIRDNFLKHVRRKLKNVPYDQKLRTFSASGQRYFQDFDQAKFLNEIGRNELITVTKLELKRIESTIKKSIDFHQEQIDLTNREVSTPAKKREYINEQNKKIHWLTHVYNPKFPSRDQNTFLASSFENGLFKGFTRKCEVDPSVTLTVIGDAIFVKLKDEKATGKTFNKKDQVVYMEM